jgi:two-component system response regulator NreC
MRAKVAATRFTRVEAQVSRILLADDHALFREALAALLEGEAGIEIVGTAASGIEAVSAAMYLRPDLVVMDLAMPGLNGVEATRRIRRALPHCQVLMLSAYLDDDLVLQAIRAGAAGFVLKDLPLDGLRVAIHSTLRNRTFFSSRITDRLPVDKLLQRAREPEQTDSYDSLTSREREVLQVVAEGGKNQQIADTLGVSIKTVEAHKTHIMAKLRARSSNDLIRYAISHGLIPTRIPEASADATQGAVGA